MQYILSQEEYDELKAKRSHEIQLSKKKLQDLCTKIADTMPVQWNWGSKKNDPEYFKPWGCVFTVEKEHRFDEWYCDQCPVQDICPSTYKPYSK